MDRRAFLKLLGLGAGATAAGLVLAEVEPIRRWWQVSASAPVGGERMRWQQEYMGEWRDVTDEHAAEVLLARDPIARAIIGVRQQDPQPLRFETGDDVRRALGSSYEDLARQVDAERQRPVRFYDVTDLRVSIGGRELKVNPAARLRVG